MKPDNKLPTDYRWVQSELDRVIKKHSLTSFMEGGATSFYKGADNELMIVYKNEKGWVKSFTIDSVPGVMGDETKYSVEECVSGKVTDQNSCWGSIQIGALPAQNISLCNGFSI